MLTITGDSVTIDTRIFGTHECWQGHSLTPADIEHLAAQSVKLIALRNRMAKRR
jgi:hypothetical protein